VCSYGTSVHCILVHGARSAILATKHKVDNPQGWLTNLLKRRHPNIAAGGSGEQKRTHRGALLAHGRKFQADYMPARMAG